MNSRREILGLFLAGLGLLTLGVASIFVLQSRASEEALQPTDFSAIPASVHYKAPDLALSDLYGAPHALSDYSGQVILINLWATWCPPCQAEMPILQDYFESHRADGFTVIAIEDGDPTADVKSFVRQYGLTFQVWLDPMHIATDRALRTDNLPSSYVVNRAGQVTLAWFGAISKANLDKYVTPIIKER